MIEKLIKILTEKQLTISFAESMTGGYLSSEVTKISGSSKVFKGAIIAYSNEVKIKLLNIPKELIDNYSIVSEEISRAMALGLKDKIQSDIYVSITGNAGPTLQDNTELFNCYYSIIYKNKIDTEQIIFKTNKRINNIKTSEKVIINKLIDVILKDG